MLGVFAFLGDDFVKNCALSVTGSTVDSCSRQSPELNFMFFHVTVDVEIWTFGVWLEEYRKIGSIVLVPP